jgi:hypothetical protein
MIRFPFLVCASLPPLSLLLELLLPRLTIVNIKFPVRVPHTFLLWFRDMVMLRFLSCAHVCLAYTSPPPLRLFTLHLPCRLAAAADAPSDVFNTDLRFLFNISVIYRLRIWKYIPQH